MADDSIGPLLWTVVESIVEVFILCVAGWVLARLGIVDRTTQKKLNRINVSLFTPCLLFSKVAFYLSPAKLKELWIIPIMFVVVTLVSALWGWALAKVFRLKRSQRSFAMAASMFMNSNSLPIALMQSLVITVPGLKWGPDDETEGMLGRALTYLVVYSTLGMMLRWSYGVHLLGQADEETSDVPDTEGGQRDALLTPGETGFPPAPSDPIYHPNHDHDSTAIDYADPDRAERSVSRGRPGVHHTPSAKHFNSFPDFAPYQSADPSLQDLNVPTINTDDQIAEGDDEWRDPRTLTIPTSTRWQSFRRRTWNVLKKLNEFMTVPMWASIASLVVACVYPLQHSLNEHAAPVKGALQNAGNCSIPLTLIVLGAYFFTPVVKKTDAVEVASNTDGSSTPGRRDDTPSTARSYPGTQSTLNGVLNTFKLRRKRNSSGKYSFFDFTGEDSADNRARKGERTTVAISIVSRMILTPAVLLPFFALFSKIGAHAVFEDPVFLVSSVLLISSPPALTLAQITQAASGDAFERLISKTIFWSYCIFTPPLTIVYVMLGMLLTNA